MIDVAEARNRRAAIATDHTKAKEALQRALAARSGLVARAARGEPVPAAEHRDIETAARDASAHAALMQDACGAADAAIVEAAAAQHGAAQSAWCDAMARAVEARCKAAAGLDAAMAAARAALDRYHAAGDALNATAARGTAFKTRFHVNPLTQPGIVLGTYLRLGLELSRPSGALNGRLAVHAVEPAERGAWSSVVPSVAARGVAA